MSEEKKSDIDIDVDVQTRNVEKGSSEYGDDLDSLVKEARIAQLKTQSEANKQKALFFESLNKNLPTIVEKVEEFLATKSESIVKDIQNRVSAQMNFLIVKHLFDGGLVERDALDRVTMQNATMYQQQQPPSSLVQDPAAEVMGNFSKPPGF